MKLDFFFETALNQVMGKANFYFFIWNYEKMRNSTYFSVDTSFDHRFNSKVILFAGFQEKFFLGSIPYQFLIVIVIVAGDTHTRAIPTKSLPSSVLNNASISINRSCNAMVKNVVIFFSLLLGVEIQKSDLSFQRVGYCLPSNFQQLAWTPLLIYIF